MTSIAVTTDLLDPAALQGQESGRILLFAVMIGLLTNTITEHHERYHRQETSCHPS